MAAIEFLTNALILVLLFRVVAVRYKYYGWDPISGTIYGFTEPICRPLKRTIRSLFALPETVDAAPWVLIIAIILIRGVLINLVENLPLQTPHVWFGIFESLLMFFNLLYQAIFVVLLISIAMLRGQVYTTRGIIPAAIRDISTITLKPARRILPTDNPVAHLIFTLLGLSFIYALIFITLKWDAVLVTGVQQGLLLFAASLQIIVLFLVVYAVISWFSPDPYNPLLRVLSAICEPILNRIRSWLPWTRMGMLDLSPLVAIIMLQLIIGLFRRLIAALPQLIGPLGL